LQIIKLPAAPHVASRPRSWQVLAATFPFSEAIYTYFQMTDCPIASAPTHTGRKTAVQASSETVLYYAKFNAREIY
jgi:hypothetical protein